MPSFAFARTLALLSFSCAMLLQGAQAEPSGEKFAKRTPARPRVLLAGGGSSHNFEKFFHQADAAILREAGCDPVYSSDPEEIVSLLPDADVLVLSSNQKELGLAPFQEGLRKFADEGKGVIVLHPGAWYNWPKETGYNSDFLGGGSRSHDALGAFTVTVDRPEHSIMKGVPASFEITDELYHITPEPTAKWEVLATTSTSKKTGKTHPSVWVVDHPKAHVAGIALGHDERAHDLDAFKLILINAVRWAAEKGPSAPVPSNAASAAEAK